MEKVTKLFTIEKRILYVKDSEKGIFSSWSGSAYGTWNYYDSTEKQIDWVAPKKDDDEDNSVSRAYENEPSNFNIPLKMGDMSLLPMRSNTI